MRVQAAEALRLVQQQTTTATHRGRNQPVPDILPGPLHRVSCRSRNEARAAFSANYWARAPEAAHGHHDPSMLHTLNGSLVDSMAATPNNQPRSPDTATPRQDTGGIHRRVATIRSNSPRGDLEAWALPEQPL
jgi:hypothetical protein